MSRDRTSLRTGRQDPEARPSPFRPSHPPDRPSVRDYFRGATLAPGRPVAGHSSPLRRPPNEVPSSSRDDRRKSARSVASEETFRWIKGDMIGKGTYGKVYLAFNATSGEIMAVKQVELPSTPADRMKKSLKDFVDALRSERQTLRHLDHENIVQYLGFEENTETVNVFLEYVSGGTVGGCYRKCGRFREDVTKNFTTQILRGLEYLHSKGIIHRDMKSDNILVEEIGVCKISDFGISKKLEVVGRAHSKLKGTSYWMAPEVVTPGSDGYDSRVDIWSLGCVVLEMWTAKRPWVDERDIFTLIFKLRVPGAAPPLPDDLVLSKTAEHFRRECFEYDQRARPTAAELLGHPYLEQDDWVFPGLQNLGEPPSTITTKDSEIPTTHSQSGGTHSTGSTIRAKSTALPIQPGTLGHSESREHHSYFPPRPKSPPLVIIAPPPPRKPATQDTGNAIDWMRSRSSSVTGSESSTSQKSSQHSATTRSRKLVVHNPDYISDLTKGKGKEKESSSKPFVYDPPPLPEVNGSVPYSNSLAPIPATRFGSTPNLNSRRQVSGRQHSASPSALQAPARPNKTGPANMKAVMANRSQSVDDATNHSSDSDSDATSSMWQIRPRNSIVPPLPLIPASPATSRCHHGAPSIAKNSRPPDHLIMAHLPEFFPNYNPHEEVVATPAEPESHLNRQEMLRPPHGHHRISSIAENSRPNNQLVMAHLHKYFPNHNLDEEVVETPVEPEFQPIRPESWKSPVARHMVLKSIKTIAAEKISKDMASPARRRQTRLWDKPIEEIKPPRPT